MPGFVHQAGLAAGEDHLRVAGVILAVFGGCDAAAVDGVGDNLDAAIGDGFLEARIGA